LCPHRPKCSLNKTYYKLQCNKEAARLEGVMGLTCLQESVDSMLHSISQMSLAENSPRDRSTSMEESFNFFLCES
jgi:hypothetical protein